MGAPVRDIPGTNPEGLGCGMQRCIVDGLLIGTVSLTYYETACGGAGIGKRHPTVYHSQRDALRQTTSHKPCRADVLNDLQ